MARISFLLAVLSVAFIVTGCAIDKKTDVRYQVDPSQVAIATGRGFAVPGAREVDLVEKMAGYRNSYQASLEELARFYKQSGDATKLGWTTQELKGLELMPKYRYLMPAQSAYADLRAVEPVPMADMLFAEAMGIYKQATELVVIKDDNKLRAALNRFNQIIDNYQTSDKIDDAAYRAGQVYEHFKDYGIAVVYYQRAFQWNDDTPYPARFRAAYVLDKYLHMKKEALLLYQLSCDKEARYTGNTKFAKERIYQLTRPAPEAEMPAETEIETEIETGIDSPV